MALVLLGAGCATTPEVVDFENPNSQPSSEGSSLRPLSEAGEEGRFINDVYFYSLALPEGIEEPVVLDYLKDAHEATALRFIDAETKQRARIEVQDPETLTLDHLKAQMELPLDEFADELIRLNRIENNFNSETKVVTDPEAVTFAGMDAYRFTVTENFKSPRGERHFEETMVFHLIRHRDLNIILSYPEENALLKSLISSLEFHSS